MNQQDRIEVLEKRIDDLEKQVLMLKQGELEAQYQMLKALAEYERIAKESRATQVEILNLVTKIKMVVTNEPS